MPDEISRDCAEEERSFVKGTVKKFALAKLWEHLDGKMVPRNQLLVFSDMYEGEGGS